MNGIGRTFWATFGLAVSVSAAAHAQRLPPIHVPGTWEGQFNTYNQLYYQGKESQLPLFYDLRDPLNRLPIRELQPLYPVNPANVLWNGMFFIGMETVDAVAESRPNPFTAQRLAARCAAAFPGDTWQQIHCAAVQTEQSLARNHYNSRGRSSGWTTDCHDHAVLLAMVFNDLHLPPSQAQVDYLWLSGHVVNKVTVTGENGLPYSYVVDAQEPDNFYPYGPNARAYYHAHPHDPLPAIGTGGLDPLLPLAKKIPWVGSAIGRAMAHFNPFSFFSGLANMVIPSPLGTLNQLPVVGGLIHGVLGFLDQGGANAGIAAPESYNRGPAFPGAADTPGYGGSRTAVGSFGASAPDPAWLGGGQNR